jgi:hypothetical protein
MAFRKLLRDILIILVLLFQVTRAELQQSEDSH